MHNVCDLPSLNNINGYFGKTSASSTMQNWKIVMDSIQSPIHIKCIILGDWGRKTKNMK